MVNITPAFTKILLVTIYGLFAFVHVVFVEITPETLVWENAELSNKANKNIDKSFFTGRIIYSTNLNNSPRLNHWP